MDTLKEWVIAIAVCAVIIEIIDILMPDGSMRKTAFVVCGIILSLCIIMPVSSIYKDLKNIDFSYSTEREAIVDAKDTYTEEQLVNITSEFKLKLQQHIEQLAAKADGIGECKAEVVIEEDYNSESYGTIYRIYVTAGTQEVEEENDKPSSGFSEYEKIERIDIGVGGITITERDEEEKTEPETDPRAIEILKLISSEFELDESNIFVTLE